MFARVSFNCLNVHVNVCLNMQSNYHLPGYRPLQDIKGCINSLFYLHNETINILTHGKFHFCSCQNALDLDSFTTCQKPTVGNTSCTTRFHFPEKTGFQPTRKFHSSLHKRSFAIPLVISWKFYALLYELTSDRRDFVNFSSVHAVLEFLMKTS